MAIENQPDALVHFIKLMDIEMIELILEDDISYQNYPKAIFISKLQAAFDALKEVGDTELFAVHGSCNGCNKCDTGVSFIGNVSGNYIDLIIQTKNDKIIDLFECTDFLNTDSHLNKMVRIEIDRLDLNSNRDSPF